MIKPLCIYHANCADGFAAAWAVRKFYGDDSVDFHPGIYGEPPPDVTDRDVILVDFSYKRPVLLTMIEQSKSVLIFDHHKTAEADLVDLPSKADAVFDMTRSGAMITWNNLFPGQMPPVLFDHIQDRDLWRFHLPMTREIMAAVYSYPMTFARWDALIDDVPLLILEQEGRVIERKQAKDIDDLLKVTTRPMIIGGHTVPVANLPYFMASDAGHYLADGQPFAATYYDTEAERVFSLRSRSSGLDVSFIAKQYGGGGHRNAAGFRVPLHQAGTDQAKRPDFPPAQPNTIGIELDHDDLARLEQAVDQLQAAAPDLSIDDCINIIFLSGLTMTETTGGIDVVRAYAQLIKRAKEAA